MANGRQRRVSNRNALFTLGPHVAAHQLGLGRERHQIAGGPAPGGKIAQQHSRHPVVDVLRQIERSLGALVAARRPVAAAVAIEAHLAAGLAEGRTPLGQVVGHQAKHAVLGKGHRLVVEGAVGEVEEEATLHPLPAYRLDELAVGQQGTAVGAQDHEAVRGTLHVPDGDRGRFGRRSQRN